MKCGGEPVLDDRSDRPFAVGRRRSVDRYPPDEQRQEIVRLLVGIRIETEVPADGGKKTVRALVEYRFPFPASGVVQFSTVTGSSRPRT